MKKVVILQYRLLHYRTTLFERLKEACAQRGIQLCLIHGQASRRESVKNDEGSLHWAKKIKNKFWELGARDLVWQPSHADLRDADLVVVMQESRILSNYPLILKRLWSTQKIAYWGHGVNFQSDAPTGFREKWKKVLIKQVDWWFAYTEMTVKILKDANYPNEQITCLNNAIDTSEFKTNLESISNETLEAMRKKLGIKSDSPVGLFCGSLYPDKKLDFLIDAIDKIKLSSKEFNCLVIGDGPSMPYVREAAETRPWLHILGVQKGIQKGLYFRLADLMLNPGLVGLHVVDAFCAGLVMVTTQGARHSPEVCYLKNGVNGILTNDTPDDYANSVISLINNPEQLNKIKTAALADSDIYTLDNMVSNFTNGIEKCLQDDRR